MVECSPATRAARVRFPDDAFLLFSSIYLIYLRAESYFTFKTKLWTTLPYHTPPRCRFLVHALARPASDFLLKPLLVSAHNLLLVPSCGAAHNCAALAAHSARPLCSLLGQHCCNCGGRGGGGRRKDDSGLVKEI